MYNLTPSSSLKYFLYARKSSESEDRQVQSIDDQVNRLTKLAQELHLEIIDTYIEAKSAKKPNNRPLFDDMIKRIEAGEANGILSWQLNRLSRNPIDSGVLSWLLQRGTLQSIQTIDRQYLPDDNVLLFNVESGMANQYIIELRKNVKRGMESKLNKGWLPSIAPTGYLNNIAERIIITDPLRFPLVRKMWDMMLTGCYTPPQILKIATEQWGLRTKKSKRRGDKELSKSTLYKIFNSIFYTGNFEYAGHIYPGKHEAMITLEEYDRVQVILGRKGKPRPQKHAFEFTGMMHCDVCGCVYTAETKKKLLKCTSRLKEYTYYHCTRKSKRIFCNQKRVIRVDHLEHMIQNEFTKYTIMPQFLDWALEILDTMEKEGKENSFPIEENQKATIEKLKNENEELTRMRYRNLIDDSLFLKEKNAIEGKIERLQSNLHHTKPSLEKEIAVTRKVFQFSTFALGLFMGKRSEPRKELLLTISEDIKIRDGNLLFSPYPWLIPIRDQYFPLEKEFKGLELHSIQTNTEQKEAVASIRSRWWNIVNDVLKSITEASQLGTIIHIPDTFS